MTVQTDTARVQYDTNGTTGPWTVPFYFLEDGHLLVVYTDSTGAETTLDIDSGDFTVTGAGDVDGGTVTTAASYAAGGTITIVRDVPYTQETEWTETDRFPASAIQRAMDKATMQNQQTKELADRSLKFSPADPGTSELPAIAARAGKLFAFNETTGEVEMSTFTQTQVASAVAAAYTAGSTADAVAFVAAGTAWIRTVQEKARDARSIKDFGAIGDNSAHPLSSRYATLLAAQAVYPFATSLTQQIDYCAAQAALNYAQSIVNSATFGGSCAKVEIPEGDYYLGANTLTINTSGVLLQGPGGRGARFWTDQNVDALVIGDPTDTDSTYNVYVDGIFIDSEDDDNTKSGVKYHRAFFCGLTNNLIRNFSKNIETARGNRVFIHQNKTTGQRSVIGQAHLWVSGSPSGNGGGLHVFDNEFGASNGVLLPDYTNGILIENVDGFYFGGNHVRDVAYGMQLAPTGGTGKNFISDVLGVGPNYMDETYTTCLKIGGTIAAGGTYQNIQYLGGLLRAANGGGGNYANYCLDIDVTDGGGFAAGGGAVRGIIIRTVLRNAWLSAVRGRGSSAGKLEVDGLDLDGSHFLLNNASGTSTVSGVDIEVASGSMMGIRAYADANAATNFANINVSSAGGASAFKEGFNDLTRSNCTGEPVAITVTGAPADILRMPSLLPGAGKRLMHSRTGTTTDRSPLIIWSRTVESVGQAALFKASVLGVSTSGTPGSVRAIFDLRCIVYRVNGSNAVLASNTVVASSFNTASNDAPVKFGLLTGTAWSGGAAVAAGDLITSGGNVYLVEVAGNLDASNPPVHTSSVVANGTAALGYVAAVAVNTVALIVSGQAATDMHWTPWIDYVALP
jgi:hypothetical protein